MTTRISLQDAADILGVSVKTVRRYVAEGKVSAYRVGPRLIRVDRAEVEALVTRIPTGADL